VFQSANEPVDIINSSNWLTTKKLQIIQGGSAEQKTQATPCSDALRNIQRQQCVLLFFVQSGVNVIICEDFQKIILTSSEIDALGSNPNRKYYKIIFNIISIGSTCNQEKKINRYLIESQS
jgi:hypothetical protein